MERALPESRRPSPPTPMNFATKPRVLIIDDEPSMLRVISRLLGRDHEVTAVNDAESALRIFRHDTGFDVVLCDVWLPTMDGMALFRRVAEKFPELAPRFVLMTGDLGGTLEELVERTRVGLLMKPFEPQALLEVVSRRAQPSGVGCAS